MRLLKKFHGWCSECGPVEHLDEDGCCATCGRDATGPGAERALRMLRSRAAVKRSIAKCSPFKAREGEAAQKEGGKP